jgi:superfamily II DNA/RNA helicase
MFQKFHTSSLVVVLMMMMWMSRPSRCRAFHAVSSTSVLTRSGQRAALFHPSKDLRLSVSALQMSSSSSAPKSSDRSATSLSRPTFRMPKQSADDSKSAAQSSGDNSLAWNPLGLWTELVDSLETELKLPAPTPVQSLVIPELLKEEKESLAFLAATGSGKTLAYLLPLVQQLRHQEVFENYERLPRRPRLLIMAPTRELALQISSVLKSLSHSIKVSSQVLVGGQDRGSQRKAIASRPVDVVVATPGRLLQHWRDETIFLGSLETIVLDEMDTMLEQGFQRELRDILYPLLYAGAPSKDAITAPPTKDKAPRVVLTSATMTQSIQKLLGDNPKTSKLAVNSKRLHGSGGGGAGGDGAEAYPKLLLPKMQIITAPGLHKAVPRLEQVFVDTGNTDKVSLLLDVVSSQRTQGTLIFCNTAASVQAVQYALAEARVESLSYHGELNSQMRSENLKKFRAGASSDNDSDPKFLVCTDLAARGLDIPQVDHVVMFDFPLNAVDYLHRSGRTARGSGQGKVTALVAKRDKVLATAIQQAVMRGDPLDGLSSRKSDYLPGARFGVQPKREQRERRRGSSGGEGGGRGSGGGGRGSSGGGRGEKRGTKSRRSR